MRAMSVASSAGSVNPGPPTRVSARIVAIAEIGWMQKDTRQFEDFATRLATFGIYLDSSGIGFNRTPGCPG